MSDAANQVNPPGFDMRNALSVEDVSARPFPTHDYESCVWGRMIIMDRRAAMTRGRYPPDVGYAEHARRLIEGKMQVGNEPAGCDDMDINEIY